MLIGIYLLRLLKIYLGQYWIDLVRFGLNLHKKADLFGGAA